MGYAKLKLEHLKMMSSGEYLEGFVALKSINTICFSHSIIHFVLIAPVTLYSIGYF